MGSSGSRAGTMNHLSPQPVRVYRPPPQRSAHAHRSQQPHQQQHTLATRTTSHAPAHNPRWAESVAHRAQSVDDNLIWPLPPRTYDRSFVPVDDSDSNDILLPPLSPRISSPPLSTTSNAEANEVHNQKESDGVTWTNKTDTQAVDSAHVQSQVSGKMHGCFNLTSMDNVSVVMNGLKQSQNDLDTRLKSRLAKISLAAEQKTDVVIQATKKEQQRLLAYDRDRQRRQHELHQEWLQKYLVELDKWRAQELAELQQELLRHQKIIVDIAQKKIQRINDEANHRKDQALDDEKTAAARRNARLTEAMFSVERNKQFLGSEVRSEIHVRVQANAGRIAPGQACTNDFPDEGAARVVSKRR